MTTEVLDIPIKETAFYNFHVQSGAKLVPFAGYKMPVSYPDGIQSEYFAVRNEVGIFDVSHMGEFTIDGSGAEAFLQKIENFINGFNIESTMDLSMPNEFAAA